MLYAMHTPRELPEAGGIELQVPRSERDLQLAFHLCIIGDNTAESRGAGGFVLICCLS